MTTEINYIAKTPFKYGGKLYKRGDIVEPVGGKWDEKIFKDGSRFVYASVVKEEVKKTPAPRRKSGGTKNAST